MEELLPVGGSFSMPFFNAGWRKKLSEWLTGMAAIQVDKCRRMIYNVSVQMGASVRTGRRTPYNSQLKAACKEEDGR